MLKDLKFGRTEWRRVGVLIGLVLVSRWPVIWGAGEVNVDESQMLAQALRCTHDAVPWRGFDGTTSGPVNTWVLWGAHAVGFPLSYRFAHALAALLLAWTVGAGYVATRRAHGGDAAWVGAGAAAWWLACHPSHDFAHYSSELVSIALISSALVCAVCGIAGELVAALLLGIVPWAKLQAAPVAAAAGMWMVVRAAWPAERTPFAIRIRHVLGVIGFALVPSICILVIVTRAGVLEDFWRSYVIANIHYAGPLAVRPLLKRGIWLALLKPIGPWLTMVGGVGFVLLLCRWRGFVDGWWRGTSTLAVGLVVMAVLACVRPVWGFEHYELLIVPGLLFATATVASVTGFARKVTNIGLLLIALGYAATQCATIFSAKAYLDKPSINAAELTLRRVREVAPGARSLAVWGWFPSLYVKSGVMPATRHAIGHYLMTDNPSRNFLSESFLRDLRAALPKVVVDSSERNFERDWHCRTIAEFPEFAEFLHERYSTPNQVESPDGPVKIYVRK